MNKQEFKAGDKVYCPMLGTGVFTVGDYASTSGNYPLKVGNEIFTRHGLFSPHRDLPSIYPATKDNHRLLSELHGVEFELPELTGSERVRQMLKENPNRAILCGVSDRSDHFAKSRPLRIVVGILEDGRFIANNGVYWKYAVVIDESDSKPQELYTGK